MLASIYHASDCKEMMELIAAANPDKTYCDDFMIQTKCHQPSRLVYIMKSSLVQDRKIEQVTAIEANARAGFWIVAVEGRVDGEEEYYITFLTW